MEGDIEAQTEQVLKNLMAVLKEAKMGPENVVKTTVFLADMADFPKMNEVYARYLGQGAARALDHPGRRPAQGRRRSRSTSSPRSRSDGGPARPGAPGGAPLAAAARPWRSWRFCGRRLGDLARAQAAGADRSLLWTPSMTVAHPLQVRVEPPVGHVVGVADPVAELGSLAADVASLSHHMLLDQARRPGPVPGQPGRCTRNSNSSNAQAGVSSGRPGRPDRRVL